MKSSTIEDTITAASIFLITFGAVNIHESNAYGYLMIILGFSMYIIKHMTISEK